MPLLTSLRDSSCIYSFICHKRRRRRGENERRWEKLEFGRRGGDHPSILFSPSFWFHSSFITLYFPSFCSPSLFLLKNSYSYIQWNWMKDDSSFTFSPCFRVSRYDLIYQVKPVQGPILLFICCFSFEKEENRTRVRLNEPTIIRTVATWIHRSFCCLCTGQDAQLGFTSRWCNETWNGNIFGMQAMMVMMMIHPSFPCDYIFLFSFRLLQMTL